VLYYGIRGKFRKGSVLFATIMVGIWFAAVYSSHHYVLDVLAGIGCGITGIVLYNLLLRKSRRMQNFIEACLRATAP
jgi:membrane-associated phospholipid phosphatase